VSAYFPIFLITLLIYFDLADAPIAGPPLLEGELPGGDYYYLFILNPFKCALGCMTLCGTYTNKNYPKPFPA
jgi:hypothetical protein